MYTCMRYTLYAVGKVSNRTSVTILDYTCTHKNLQSVQKQHQQSLSHVDRNTWIGTTARMVFKKRLYHTGKIEVPWVQLFQDACQQLTHHCLPPPCHRSSVWCHPVTATKTGNFVMQSLSMNARHGGETYLPHVLQTLLSCFLLCNILQEDRVHLVNTRQTAGVHRN